MTWQNVMVSSAESKTELETRFNEVVSSLANEAQDMTLTGKRAWADYQEPIHVNLPSSYTCLRFGYWAYTYGAAHDEEVYGYTLLGFRTNASQRFSCNVHLRSNLCGFHNTALYRPDASYSTIPLGSTTLLKMGEWQHYGFVMRPNTFTFFLNGQQIIQANNPVYSDGFTPITHATMMRSMSPAGLSSLVTDVYMDKSSDPDEPITAPPPLRFFPVNLQAIGAYNQWQAISPLEIPNEILSRGNFDPTTTTYYQVNASGQRQTFQLGALDLPAGQALAGLGAQIYCDRDERELDLSIELGGTTTDAALQTNTREVGGYAAPGLYMPLNPDGDPWTLADLTTCSVGVRSQ